MQQLDEFFGNDYDNRANEPDLQVPSMYNASTELWKSQELMHHRLAVDTVVQHYFNDNSRGIGSYVGGIYKNQPAAYPARWTMMPGACLPGLFLPPAASILRR